MAKFKNDKGLTLIELLITIAVLAVVSAIALPVINNVVSASNSNALNQTVKDANDFVNKYSKSGVVAYDALTKTLSGYVDTDGDNVIDANEKIDTLTLDDKYSATATGSTQVGGSYSVGGVTAVVVVAAGTSSAPSVTLSFGTQMWDGGAASGYNNGWIHFVGATASNGDPVEYSIEVSTDGGNTWVKKTQYEAYGDGYAAYQGSWFSEADAIAATGLYDFPGVFGSPSYYTYRTIAIPDVNNATIGDLYPIGTQLRIVARVISTPAVTLVGSSYTLGW